MTFNIRPLPKLPDDLDDRFWSKVLRADGDACWEWQGGATSRGYGRIRIDRRTYGAHRVAWKIANGDDPSDKLVCHKCDNPICVRPDHLMLGTHIDNMADCYRKNRFHRWRGTRAGDGNPKVKVPSAVVPEIVQRYKAGGVLQKELARDYGVSRRQISDIVRGRRSA